MLPTIIWRHRKENLKKCSLRGLEKRADMLFVTYPTPLSFDPDSYILLSMEGPPLSLKDREKGLLLIDGTWKYASIMENQLPKIEKRSIPQGFITAYPRKQTACPDPEIGLASIEALYIAYHLLGYPFEGLLDNYYWKEDFFRKNPVLSANVNKLVN